MNIHGFEAIIVCGRYFLIRLIGHGSFGLVYHGRDIITNEMVAVKLENITTRHPQLENEYNVYHYHLKNVTDGFPRVLYFGRDVKHHLIVLVLELLGPSLETLFVNCERKFSLKTILMMSDQMISRIEQLHTKGLVHRDIKPENFLIGSTALSTQIYLIDFGLSISYNSSLDGQHIVCSRGHNFIGTTRYASISAHRGIQQSRRDDLESIGYVILYFLKGSLPWQRIFSQSHNKKQEHERVLEKKLSMSVDVLCQQLPLEFRHYLTYCRNRKFDEKPDYEHLRKMFRNLFHKLSYRQDFKFDWTERIDWTETEAF